MHLPEVPSARGLQEVERRKEHERAKYDKEAPTPAGHPDVDVFNCLLDKLVGLIHYAEMSRARIDLMRKLSETRIRQLDHSWALFDAIETFAIRSGAELAELRFALKDMGFMLGQPEGEHERD